MLSRFFTFVLGEGSEKLFFMFRLNFVDGYPKITKPLLFNQILKKLEVIEISLPQGVQFA
jgi:hypothetical protein